MAAPRLSLLGESVAPRRLSQGVVAVALVIGAGLLPGCHRSRRPDVILISLDTFRRDLLDAHGTGGAPLTPALRAFARESVTFSDAFVPVPFTLPSHMSLLTGLRPAVHGVLGAKDVLPRSVRTLAEVLKKGGYHTIGLHTNEWLSAGFGFSRGFDRYEQLPHGLTYAGRVVDAALGAVDWTSRERAPVFLFLHFMDAHSDFPQQGTRLPYYSPPELRRDLDVGDERTAFCDERGQCATEYLLALDREKRSLDPGRIEMLHRLYERGAQYLDGQVGRLLDALRSRGVLSRALVVVTSDHGEEFREHGQFLHSQVYDECIAVPLLVRFPDGGGAGRKVRGLVENVDVMPTILALAGLESDGPALQGRSLLPLLVGGEGRPRVFAYDKLNPAKRAVRTPDHKLVVDRASGESEFFDLAADPGEARSLPPSELSRTLARELAELTAADRERGEILAEAGDGGEALTPEQKGRLRSLGYLR